MNKEIDKQYTHTMSKEDFALLISIQEHIEESEDLKVNINSLKINELDEIEISYKIIE